MDSELAAGIVGADPCAAVETQHAGAVRRKHSSVPRQSAADPAHGCGVAGTRQSVWRDGVSGPPDGHAAGAGERSMTTVMTDPATGTPKNPPTQKPPAEPTPV